MILLITFPVMPAFLRLAEEDEAAAGAEAIKVPAYALEEHYFHTAAGVFHNDAHPLALACAYGTLVLGYGGGTRPVQGSGNHACEYLHRSEVRGDLRDGGNAVAVDIAEGKEVDKVFNCLNIKLLLE